MRRCDWATNDLAIRYHDEEWGVPVYDDRRWFEFLVLEGAQAGLSWDTVLKKRERYRQVFDHFDPVIVARYEAKKVESLLADPGIIRNRLKVASAIQNARAFLQVQGDFGSFDAFVWRFVEGQPIKNSWKSHQEVPARTEVSDAMSKDLKRRGFTFVGSTICYALMQATGMVKTISWDASGTPRSGEDRVPGGEDRVIEIVATPYEFRSAEGHAGGRRMRASRPEGDPD